MKSKQNVWKAFSFSAQLYMTMLIFLLAACDDGYISVWTGLDTSVEVDSNAEEKDADKTKLCNTADTLEDYMNCHDNLLPVLHYLFNFREPLYFCFYEITESHLKPLINKTPIGRFGTDEGIPFGEFAAVAVPGITLRDLTDTNQSIYYALTTDGVTQCPEDAPLVDPLNDRGTSRWIITDYMDFQEFDNPYMSPHGYLWGTAENVGAEKWEICGSTWDAPCEIFADYAFRWSNLSEEHVTPDNTTLVLRTIIEGDSVPALTLCWDADDKEETPSIKLFENTDWNESRTFEPIVTGTLHLHQGYVDCASVSVNDALTTQTMPAPMTFGPEDGRIEFAGGSYGSILITGVFLEGEPVQIEPSIIPLLHW